MNILPVLRCALVEWMLDRRDRAAVHVAVPPRGHGSTDGHDSGSAQAECWSIGEVLYALWDDPAPVPDGVVALLRLPPAVTMGQVARLLYVVHADRSPSSYADVVEHLARLPRHQIVRLLEGVVDTCHDQCRTVTVEALGGDGAAVPTRG